MGKWFLQRLISCSGSSWEFVKCFFKWIISHLWSSGAMTSWLEHRFLWSSCPLRNFEKWDKYMFTCRERASPSPPGPTRCWQGHMPMGVLAAPSPLWETSTMMGLMVRTALTLQSSIYCENNMYFNVFIDNSDHKPSVCKYKKKMNSQIGLM